jgi:hypothetical protein
MKPNLQQLCTSISVLGYQTANHSPTDVDAIGNRHRANEPKLGEKNHSPFFNEKTARS